MLNQLLKYFETYYPIYWRFYQVSFHCERKLLLNVLTFGTLPTLLYVNVKTNSPLQQQKPGGPFMCIVNLYCEATFLHGIPRYKKFLHDGEILRKLSTGRLENGQETFGSFRHFDFHAWVIFAPFCGLQNDHNCCNILRNVLFSAELKKCFRQ